MSTEQTTSSLEALRERVSEVTNELLGLYLNRQELMAAIAASKARTGETLPVYLPNRESVLLKKWRDAAQQTGEDADHAELVLSVLMYVAKARQLRTLKRDTVLETAPVSDTELRQNLLDLTQHTSKMYKHYAHQAGGTHQSCTQELRWLKQHIASVHTPRVVLNLGCADGTHVSDLFTSASTRVIGYDVSPSMIELGSVLYPQHEFMLHDLDTSIPMPSSSVDLVIANFGAGSEVCRDILFREVARVLRKDGTAFLSFYNKDALVTKWWTPWSRAVRTVLNPHNDTLLVVAEDEMGDLEPFWIYAKALGPEEIRTHTHTTRLQILNMRATSPLWDDKPNAFFRDSGVIDAVMAYEEGHAAVPPFLGQYLSVVLRKVHY